MTSARDLVRDLGHAARRLLRSPAHVAVVVTTLAVGVSAAVAGRLTRPLLVGVAPFDPVTLLLAALALVAVAGLAAWLPARRAALVDPAAVLRQE